MTACYSGVKMVKINDSKIDPPSYMSDNMGRMFLPDHHKWSDYEGGLFLLVKDRLTERLKGRVERDSYQLSVLFLFTEEVTWHICRRKILLDEVTPC